MNLKRKQLALILCSVVFITVLLTSAIVIAAIPSTILTLSGGNYPGATSYTVFSDGTTIFAKNALGVISYSGMDFAVVFQSAIDTLATPNGEGIFGGTVYVKKSATDYTVSSPIILKNRVNLVGEKDATLKAVEEMNCIFSLDYDVSTRFNIEVSGFRLEGNSLVEADVIFRNVYGVIKFTDMELYGVTSYGVRFNGNTWGVTFENVRITAPAGGSGIGMFRVPEATGGNNLNSFYYTNIVGSGSNVYIKGDAYGNSFIRCHFEGNGQGVIIEGDGTYIPTLTHIFDCWFERGEEITTQKGVKIIDSSPYATKPRQTIIENCHFGIYFVGIFVEYAEKTVIKNNYFTGTSSDAIEIMSGAEDTYIEGGLYDSPLYDIGLNSIWRGVGFENSGVATVSTGATVEHGLVGTPQVVTVTPLASAGDFYVSNIGASTFKINFAGGGSVSFAWVAGYTP